MAQVLRISPEGEFEFGVGEDDDGTTFCRIDLPERSSGNRAELVFTLAAFVTFADWIAMIADELVNEAKHGPDAPSG